MDENKQKPPIPQKPPKNKIKKVQFEKSQNFHSNNSFQEPTQNQSEKSVQTLIHQHSSFINEPNKLEKQNSKILQQNFALPSNKNFDNADGSAHQIILRKPIQVVRKNEENLVTSDINLLSDLAEKQINPIRELNSEVFENLREQNVQSESDSCSNSNILGNTKRSIILNELKNRKTFIQKKEENSMERFDNDSSSGTNESNSAISEMMKVSDEKEIKLVSEENQRRPGVLSDRTNLKNAEVLNELINRRTFLHKNEDNLNLFNNITPKSDNVIIEEYKSKEKEFAESFEKFEKLYIAKFDSDKRYAYIDYLTDFKKLIIENRKFLYDLENCKTPDDVGKLLSREETVKTLFESTKLWNPIEQSIKCGLEDIFNKERPENETSTFGYYMHLPRSKALTCTVYLQRLIKQEKEMNETTYSLEVALKRLQGKLSNLKDEYGVNRIKSSPIDLTSICPCLSSAGFYNKKDVHYQLFLFNQKLIFTTSDSENYKYANSVNIDDLDFSLKDKKFYQFSNCQKIKYILRPDSHKSDPFLNMLTDKIVEREKERVLRR